MNEHGSEKTEDVMINHFTDPMKRVGGKQSLCDDIDNLKDVSDESLETLKGLFSDSRWSVNTPSNPSELQTSIKAMEEKRNNISKAVLSSSHNDPLSRWVYSDLKTKMLNGGGNNKQQPNNSLKRRRSDEYDDYEGSSPDVVVKPPAKRANYAKSNKQQATNNTKSSSSLFTGF